MRAKLPHVPLNTCYKGRLLLAMMVEEVSDRLAPKVKSIGPCSDPSSEPFVLRFDLYQASQLDERSVPDNTQISVELQVGGLTMLSTTGLAEHGADGAVDTSKIWLSLAQLAGARCIPGLLPLTSPAASPAVHLSCLAPV